MAPAWRHGRLQEAVDGRSPLHLAVMRPDDSLTLPSSTDVDSEDDAGCTALHYAAEAGNDRAVGVLLARGASANAADEHGSTPLAQAVLHRHVGAAEQLLDRANRMLARSDYCEGVDCLEPEGDGWTKANVSLELNQLVELIDLVAIISDHMDPNSLPIGDPYSP